MISSRPVQEFLVGRWVEHLRNPAQRHHLYCHTAKVYGTDWKPGSLVSSLSPFIIFLFRHFTAGS